MAEGKKLPREFYQQDGLELAPALIGKRLVHRTGEGAAGGLIVEVEAYVGPEDAAAHSYQGRRTARTAVQYGPGGFAYVFSIYGLHNCFNVVAGPPERPEVVLIRALEPTGGLDLMARRRGRADPLELCSGPGKLCQALGITKAQYGMDLCGEELFLEDAGLAPEVAADKRINIDYAGEAVHYPWRFVWRDSPFLSVPVPFAK